MSELGNFLLDGINDEDDYVPQNPVELFNSINAGKKELKQEQIDILEEWVRDRPEERDVIVKMHTGEGKTLVGLLMLHYRVLTNKGERGGCLYLCPNHQLEQQVLAEARKFAIPCCSMADSVDNELPADFVYGRKLMVAVAQKLFTGLTKFKSSATWLKLDMVVIDDAQLAPQIIRGALTLKIDRNNESHQKLYQDILELFRSDLHEQREVTLAEIDANHDPYAELGVPYWCWNEKLDRVRAALAPCHSLEGICLAWELIKNSLQYCQCFISGSSIEISPCYPSVRGFLSFTDASQRVLMTASTQDDSFMIKSLGFSAQAVNHPLKSSRNLYYGERLLFIPAATGFINHDTTVSLFMSGGPAAGCNRVALVRSSYEANKIREWLPEAIIADKSNITAELEKLKTEAPGKVLLVVNRYDGIDLPGECCRLLLIDKCPRSENMAENYEVSCRKQSDLIKKKIAQSIEQGIGRAVRSKEDFCTVLLAGRDLSEFMLTRANRKYFSAQTQAQLELGDRLMQKVQKSGDGKAMLESLKSLIAMQLSRDAKLTKTYDEAMQKIREENVAGISELIEQEARAEEFFQRGKFADAAQCFTAIINSHPKFSNDELGWYQQQKARCLYMDLQTREAAQDLQFKAHDHNEELLISPVKQRVQPPVMRSQIEGVFSFIEDLRAQSTDFSSSLADFKTSLLLRLSFDSDSDDFEQAWRELGHCLGFDSSRPEKKFGVGPDDMWGIGNGRYLLFECKNMVRAERESISKKETGQMQQHLTWFENYFGEFSCQVESAIWVHPASVPDEKVSLPRGALRIIDIAHLQTLHSELEVFLNELSGAALSQEFLASLLKKHKFTASALVQTYSVPLKDE